jgi:hypothetical protein
MSMLQKFKWRMRRRTKEEELLEELQFHLSEEAEERTADGLPYEDVRQRLRVTPGVSGVTLSHASLVKAVCLHPGDDLCPSHLR